MKRNRERHLQFSDQGAVLLLCLLLLSSLTILGLAAATDHVLQKRMSGNHLESSMANHSAESTLKWGRDWLFGLNGATSPSACSSACGPMDVIRSEGFYGEVIEHQDTDWWKQNAFPFGKDPVTGVLMDEFTDNETERNYWLIEEVQVESSSSGLSLATEIAYYRISARSSPGNNEMFTVTQSIVARPWGDEVLSNSFPKPSGETGICFAFAHEIPCGRLAWRRLQ